MLELSDIIKRLQTEVSTEYSHAPSAAETINASHTEILTVPGTPGELRDDDKLDAIDEPA